MKFGVVVFPGSNCDHDAFYAIGNVLHKPVEFIWHQSQDLANCDAVILPGGFAHGDYLRTGAIARFSPVMKSVEKFASTRRHGPRHLQWLPDSAGSRFASRSDDAQQRPALYLPARPHSRRANRHAIHERCKRGQILTVPIAHNDGNYTCDDATLADLEKNRQVIFRYTTPDGIG